MISIQVRLKPWEHAGDILGGMSVEQDMSSRMRRFLTDVENGIQEKYRRPLFVYRQYRNCHLKKQFYILEIKTLTKEKR